MTLRPARVDKGTDKPSYTRREYVNGVPGVRITNFVMGNKKSDFPFEVSLQIDEEVQIRQGALESGRVAATGFMNKNVGEKNYKMKLNVYPFEILRENPMATGRKADRYGNGMSRPFGRPIGLAARLSKDQKLITAWVNEENIKEAKEAFRRTRMKLPCGGYVRAYQDGEDVTEKVF